MNFILKWNSLFASDSGYNYAKARLIKGMQNGEIFSLDWQFMGEDANKNGVLDECEDENGNNVIDVVSFPLDTQNDIGISYRSSENPYLFIICNSG